MTTDKLLHISELQFPVPLNGHIVLSLFPSPLLLRMKMKCQMENCFGNCKVLHILTIIAILFQSSSLKPASRRAAGPALGGPERGGCGLFLV